MNYLLGKHLSKQIEEEQRINTSERSIPQLQLKKLPKSAPIRYSSPVSVIQDSTCIKSATKEGTWHFRTAALPRMTYSLFTSVS